MNSRRFTLLVLSGLLVGLGVTTASAQMITQVKANIPFEFMAGSKTLPAGEYTVSSQVASGALVIRSEDSRETAFVIVNRAGTPNQSDQASLVFHRYGNRYFLSQILTPGVGMSFQVPESKVEREASRSASVQRQNLTILAQR